MRASPWRSLSPGSGAGRGREGSLALGSSPGAAPPSAGRRVGPARPGAVPTNQGCRDRSPVPPPACLLRPRPGCRKPRTFGTQVTDSGTPRQCCSQVPSSTRPARLPVHAHLLRCHRGAPRASRKSLRLGGCNAPSGGGTREPGEGRAAVPEQRAPLRESVGSGLSLFFTPFGAV